MKEGARSEVKVVTFDLDNTLWKTSEVISSANDALAIFLDECNATTPVRVEKIMGELFQQNKARYCPDLILQDANATTAAKSPVLLTQLRKDAIQEVMVRHNDYELQEATDFAAKAFDVWTQARHDAIPSHFASSVLSCLEGIRKLQRLDGQSVLIGAITDGNSDPRRLVEEVVGPWWVHIGDDFIKDIVAAKELKMRTIWCRELVKPKEDMVAAPNSNNEQGSQKQRSVEDLVKEMSNMKVVEMSIGAEDFLLDSMEREFADAVIDEFHHLGTVMAEWHAEGFQVKQSPPAPEPAKDNDISYLGLEVVFPDDDADEVQAAIPTVDAPTSRVPETAVTESSSPVTPETKADTKFCVFCGAKIPAVAKFCSSCGEKQL
eukprot:scaffold178847_cov56-Attheya_sp.AAC.4